MAVCHTVVPELEAGQSTPGYNAESPDEAALTHAAREVGFEFRAREADHIIVRRHAAPPAAPR
jgi:phospholipid-translocating ATPase